MAEFDIRAIFSVEGINQLQASFKQVGAASKNLGTSLRTAGQDAARFGRNVAIIGTAAGAAVGTAVLAARDFEKDFSAVATLLDESSFSAESLQDGISGLRDGVIDLRAQTGQTFEDLNKGLFDLISATGDAENGIRNLDVATQLAIAGNTDVSTAVVGLTNVLGAYGDEAGTVEEISQKFFAAQKDGRTTIEELANDIGRVASTAKATNISFEELLASVSSATVAGIDTNRAFTGVAAAIENISKPSQVAIDEAGRLGVQFNQTQLETVGLIRTLELVTQSSNFTSESFTKLFGSREGRNFANALASDFDRVNGTLKTLNNESQLQLTFANALEVASGTLDQQLARFSGTVQALGVNIGTSLTPAVSEMLSIFSAVLSELAPEIEAFFADASVDVLEFVKGFRDNIPSAVDAFRAGTDIITQLISGLIQAFGLVSVAVSSFLAVMDVLALAIPGVSGEGLALFLVIGQLTGGFRLLFSVMRVGFAVFKLMDAIMIATGVISQSLALSFRTAMLALISSSAAAVKRVVASLIVLGTSMTSFSGVLGLASTAARAFWLALTGPAGIIIAVVAGIGLIVTNLIGFENIVNAIKSAWEGVVAVVSRAAKFIADIFRSSSEGEIDVNVNANRAGIPEGFADGGKVKGKGTSRSDSIPAMLSNGEYVINAASVKKFGARTFDLLNNGLFPAVRGFADGGLVEALGSSLSRAGTQSAISMATPVSGSPARIGRPLNLILPSGEVIKATTDEDTATKLQKNLRRADSVKASDLPRWY